MPLVCLVNSLFLSVYALFHYSLFHCAVIISFLNSESRVQPVSHSFEVGIADDCWFIVKSRREKSQDFVLLLLYETL